MDPTATAPNQGAPEAGEGHKGACCSSCIYAARGARAGAWVGRLSEPMEVSEDTTDETMEGGLSKNSEPVQERRENAGVCKICPGLPAWMKNSRVNHKGTSRQVVDTQLLGGQGQFWQLKCCVQAQHYNCLHGCILSRFLHNLHILGCPFNLIDGIRQETHDALLFNPLSCLCIIAFFLFLRPQIWLAYCSLFLSLLAHRPCIGLGRLLAGCCSTSNFEKWGQALRVVSSIWGADGDVLLNARLPVHVSPTEASTQGLVRELKALDEAQGAHILCPVPLVAISCSQPLLVLLPEGPLVEPKVVPRFLAALSEAGAHAERVEAYETSAGCNSSACALEMDALKAGHIDAIAFSSTAESTQFTKDFLKNGSHSALLAQGLKGIYGEGLKDVLLRHNVILAAHGPYTRDGVQEMLRHVAQQQHLHPDG
eukprot:1151581-Pelagomonas_calceolata.AAC.10